MRGYAFSQEEGTGRIMAPPLRRRKTNPGPIVHTPKEEFSLRRRSLPEVRASKDLIDILGEGEKMKMVHFRESIASASVITSREDSENINEETGIQSSSYMSENESEREPVNENNNGDESQAQPVIEQEQSLDNNDKTMDSLEEKKEH
jgi:hypothetical protein